MQLDNGLRLGDYTVLGPIGAGGMGEVYRARDRRLGRDVAIKVLPTELASDADRRARFEREARAIAALNHPSIVTIHTIGEHEGIPYLAMELVDGETLAHRIPADGMPADELLGVAESIASALAEAHAKGIVHRDLKPTNVMVTGSGAVKVLDFGLAKLAHGGAEPPGDDSETAAMTLQTGVGTMVGTMPYMSPEQISGRPVGPASDLFSFGVMLYEMATGRRPFKGATGPSLISSILTDSPPHVEELNPSLPEELGSLVERCLSKDPAGRPGDAVQLRDELAGLRRRTTATSPTVDRPPTRLARRPVVIGAALAAVAIGAATVWYIARTKRIEWARTVALPQVERLLDEGDEDSALRLILEVRSIIPDDPQLHRLVSENTVARRIESDPPGAEILVNSYDDRGRPWLPLGVTPAEVRLPFGEYRFQVVKEGYVPFNGTGIAGPNPPRPVLVPIGDARDGMVFVPGGPVEFGREGAKRVGPFWFDKTEVTNRRFQEFVDAGGYRRPEYWTEPIVVGGRSLPFDEAIAMFIDQTGQPGPAGWELGSYQDGRGDHPVGGVSWYEAMAFCEWSGVSLPTVFHWYRAARQGLFADIIRLSNFAGEGPAPVGSFRGLGPFGTYDMAGNVREWCFNRGNDARYCLGGAWSDPPYTYHSPSAEDPLDRSPKNGFRTMIPVGDIEPDTMVAIDNPVFDFRNATPIDDDGFELLAGAFDYDPKDLDARVESVDDSPPHWRRERISFAAAYGGERVPADLYLPRNAEPPYQTVVFFPSSAAVQVESSRDPALFFASYLIRSGRALMYPIYKGTYERRIEVSGPHDLRDMIVSAGKDLRRSIDYLETRDDIDTSKLAYCGLSLGATWGPIFTAIEDRFAASILVSGGLSAPEPGRPPESLGINFAPRSTVPVLMLNGRNDFWSPLDTEIRPMLDLMGAPPEDKKLVLLDGGHVPERPKDAIRPALDWLDRYLGPVR